VDEKGPFGGQKYLHFVTFCDRKRTFWWSKIPVIPANTGKVLLVSVFGVPNTGIPLSVYTGLEFGNTSVSYHRSKAECVFCFICDVLLCLLAASPRAHHVGKLQKNMLSLVD
jgi:hypothetical protein